MRLLQKCTMCIEKGSRGGVRTRERRSFFLCSFFFGAGKPSRVTHVRRISMSGPIRPAASRAGRKFRFPAQSPVSVLNYHLASVIHSWTPTLLCFCLGDG